MLIANVSLAKMLMGANMLIANGREAKVLIAKVSLAKMLMEANMLIANGH